MHQIYYLAYMVYLLAILSLLFFDRKKPLQRFNWILVLIFLPGIGLFMYLFFGSNFYLEYRRRKLMGRHEESFKTLEKIVHQKTQASISVNPHSQAREFHRQYGKSAFTTNNNVKVFTSGAEKFTEMFQDLQKARHHIHLLYFTLHNDRIGRHLINILTEKVEQGVEVKLLYDSLGSFLTMGYQSSMLRKLRKAGGETSNIRPHLMEVNYRNHRKIVVIDGSIGYTGGMNIGERYEDGIVDKPWRDTHVRITGSAVHHLQKVFLSDWLTSSYFPLKKLPCSASRAFESVLSFLAPLA